MDGKYIVVYLTDGNSVAEVDVVYTQSQVADVIRLYEFCVDDYNPDNVYVYRIAEHIPLEKILR
jgi:predicted alpha/beta superfamily hydrolase